jgi:hypothetical protein
VFKCNYSNNNNNNKNNKNSNNKNKASGGVGGDRSPRNEAARRQLRQYRRQRERENDARRQAGYNIGISSEGNNRTLTRQEMVDVVDNPALIESQGQPK